MVTGAEGGVGFTWEVTGVDAFVGAAGVVGLACGGGWLGFCVGNAVGLLGLSGTAWVVGVVVVCVAGLGVGAVG